MEEAEAGAEACEGEEAGAGLGADGGGDVGGGGDAGLCAADGEIACCRYAAGGDIARCDPVAGVVRGLPARWSRGDPAEAGVTAEGS